MKLSKKTLATAFLSLTALVAGCASPPKFQTATVPANGPIESLYFYSFLDVRERELGANYMREIEKQLEAALTERGVRSAQLWFNRAAIRGELALNAQTERTWRSSESTVRIPVREVLVSNAGEQLAFGPSHVLVLVPTDTSSSGTGFTYTLTWKLVDVSGNTAWSATSRTHNMNLLVNDELPVQRAHALVEGLMQELEKSRLLPAVGGPAKAR